MVASCAGVTPTSVIDSPPGKLSTALPLPSSPTVTSPAWTGVVPQSEVRPVTSSWSTVVPSPESVMSKAWTVSLPPKSASTMVSPPLPRTICSISSKLAVDTPSLNVPVSGLALVRSMVRSSVTRLRSSTSPVTSSMPSALIVSLPKLFSMRIVSSLKPDQM